MGAIGCLLIIAVLVAIGVGVFAIDQFAQRTFATPGDIADAYTTAITDDDVPAAYDLLCEELRTRTSQDAFGRQVEAQLEGIGPVQRVERNQTIPRALDRYSVYRRLRGTVSSRELELTVIREDDAWRVCRIEWQR